MSESPKYKVEGACDFEFNNKCKKAYNSGSKMSKEEFVAALEVYTSNWCPMHPHMYVYHKTYVYINRFTVFGVMFAVVTGSCIPVPT